jgi:hypothetical protein
VACVPTAPVAHSHARRFRALLGRTRALHRVFIEAGEAPAVPDVATLVRALPGVVGRDLRGASGELLGQYLAARDMLHVERRRPGA